MTNRDRILQILWENQGRFVSGESIAETLNVSRNAVWKSINKIKEDGVEVVAYRRLGYMIPMGLDVLSSSTIQSYLVGGLEGVPIHVFNTLPSTNDYAKELAKDGAPEYTLVVADTQTHGKGRLGRRFESPSGTGIYMSFILRPTTTIETAQLITSCVAVAISKAIDSMCGSNTKIKWVNDVFLNGKKVSGTLTEGAIDFETNSFSYAVVGIGINVRSVKGIFGDELTSIATSIEDETGLKVSRSRLIAEVFNNVYREMKHISDRSFLQEYRRRSLIIGEKVIVSQNGKDTYATALDIDESAGLLVMFQDGSTKVLNSGEARIRKEV